MTASLILGLLWAYGICRPSWCPGPLVWPALGAFVLLTIEYSILMTWVFLHTLGSVLIATLFQRNQPIPGMFLSGVDGASRYWLLSIVYGVAALIAAVALGLTALRKPAASAQHVEPRTCDSSTKQSQVRVPALACHIRRSTCQWA